MNNLLNVSYINLSNIKMKQKKLLKYSKFISKLKSYNIFEKYDTCTCVKYIRCSLLFVEQDEKKKSVIL